MEVRLDTDEGQKPPPDMFVSMRIGDVQKQSRLSSSKTYRFPDPGDERACFGRIEVFQRVGHLNVNFNSLDGDLQDVEVPCSVAGFGALRLQLSVKGPAAVAEVLPPITKKSRSKQRMDAAQKYLAEHKLEELLADAMREVINAKPQDPHTFLSTQILKHMSGSNEDTMLPNLLPPLTGTGRALSLAEELPVRPPSRNRSSAREKLPPLCLGETQEPKLPAPQSKAAAFGTYYADHFKCVEPSAMAGLYSQFARANRGKVAESPPAASKAVEADARRVPFHHLPSVGSWSSKRPTGTLLAAAAAAKAEAAAAEAAAAAAAAKKAQEPPPLPFAYRPSVGSWLCRKPVEVPRPWYYKPLQAEDNKIILELQQVIAKKEAELEALKAQMRRATAAAQVVAPVTPVPQPLVMPQQAVPALQPILPPPAAASQQAAPPSLAEAAPTKTAPQLRAPPLTPFGVYYHQHFAGFAGDSFQASLYANFKPVPRPQPAAKPAPAPVSETHLVPAPFVPFCLRPSVGSWLTTRGPWHEPAEVGIGGRRPSEELEAGTTILDRSDSNLERMETEELVSVFEHEMAERDREIRMLMEMLAARGLPSPF